MPAGAAFEAAAGDGQLAIAADVNAVRTAAFGAAAKPRKGRALDRDCALLISACQYPFFRIAEGRADDVEITPFEPDARAIAVRDTDVLEHDAVDRRVHAVEHQRRFAAARATVENRGRGGCRTQRQILTAENRAILVGARRDDNRPRTLADRVHRFVEPVIGLAGFGDSKGRAIRRPGRLGHHAKQPKKCAYLHLIHRVRILCVNLSHADTRANARANADISRSCRTAKNQSRLGRNQRRAVSGSTARRLV